MIWRTAERHIGIIGMYNAGKTVLLTSLIDHLMNHDPLRFRLGDVRDPVTLRRVRAEPVTPGWAEFPYSGFRNALTQEGKWPRKTKDRFEFACRFERSDWRFNEPLVRFYDMPGERLADAAMFGKSYAEWSDHWHRYTSHDRLQQEVFAPYLEALKHPGTTPQELIDAYRLSLATAIAAYKPFVSPSAFYLAADGTLPAGSTPAEIRQGRYVGLDQARQFTPLSAELRAANPAFAAEFAKHYAEYQTAMIEPFIAALASCHSLIVLVDVIELLQSGVGMANDNRQMLRDLLEVITPGEGVLRVLQRVVSEALFQHRSRWVNKIAFVAPKADLVHPNDRDRLRHLLARFLGNMAHDHDGLKHECFVVSSIVSTSAMPGEKTLLGIPYRDASGAKLPMGEKQKIHTPELPDDWPLDWSAGQFSFPQVYPQMPAFKAYPPEQLGLDRVLNFVLG